METVERLLARVSAEKREKIERIAEIYTAGRIAEFEMHAMINGVMMED